MNTALMPTPIIDPTQDPRWLAMINRDPEAEGNFFYAVITTGVYCRPTCPSRRPKPENVRFFDCLQDAEEAGFIPCKRCQPTQPSKAIQHSTLVTQACRQIESAETMPSLDDLATQANLSKYHFHRIFKQATGLTPREYAAARKEHRVREHLGQQKTVTAAIYDAGYQSNSRFYERSNDILGMPASTFRKGGEKADIRFALGESYLGSILVAQSEKGVCAILLGDNPELLLQDLQKQFPKANLIGGDSNFEQVVATVVGFVESPDRGLNLPLDIRGTAFQQRVWQALRDIPAGTTLSYSEVAHIIGAPTSSRAVAQACAANTLAVAIPCHRVVRQDGSLSGYRWGVARKQELLNREAEESQAS